MLLIIFATLIPLMKKILVWMFVAVFCVDTAFAQDESLKKIKNETARQVGEEFDQTFTNWNTGGMFNLNISQGSLKNWAAGGDDFSLSLNGILNYFAQYRYNKISWDNNVDFNIGYLQTTSLGGLKNDDRIDILSKLGYKLGEKVNASVLGTLRTQLFDGYTDGDFTSTIMSPAYVVGSLGFDVKPIPKFSLFISPIASRWVMVTNNDIAVKGLYGIPAGQKSINQIGAFATANFNNKIGKNVNYKMRFDAFSNYKHNPQNIDIFMANVFTFKISKFLSATYSLDLIYDDDLAIFGENGTSPALQVKSLIGIGLAVPLAGRPK